jgi:uncharacterized cofD-like protein
MAQVRGADPAEPDEISIVRGQVAVATTPGEVVEVSLEPADPKACPEATRALGEADWVVLGPGSWYSSVIPHLLVPGLRDALAATPGNVVVTLNLEAQPGETEGWTPEDHLDVLHRTAPDLRVHTVLADPGSVHDTAALEEMAEGIGARLVLADVARQGAPGQHDPEKLARAYARVTGAN